MPRPRLYKNQAERQAAYRARHPERRPPRQDRLAGLARSLHFVLAEAVHKQRCPLPDQLLGARPDETLCNMIRYLDPDPDPIRYADIDVGRQSRAKHQPEK
jgi:hypothetical protein